MFHKQNKDTIDCWNVLRSTYTFQIHNQCIQSTYTIRVPCICNSGTVPHTINHKHSLIELISACYANAP